MDPRRTRYLVGAGILLGVAAFNFLTYTSTTTLQSTLAIQLGLAEDISTTRSSGDSISGDFHETSGMLVSFFILNSAQFASHQVGGSFNYLYSLQDTPSGSFSYTTQTQDTYYLFFDHGTGLSNTGETVYFQRTYLTHSLYRLQLGLVFIAIAGVDLVFALRIRTPETPELPPPVPTVAPPSP